MQNDPNFRTRQILNSLLEWAEHTGGWESPVWAAARAYRDSLLPPEPEAPLTKLYRVEGTVHLADGFNYVIEATSPSEAETKAEARVRAADDLSPEIQEVCVQSVREEREENIA